MNWILIIAMHVGPMGEGNSNALTNVAGFKSKEACQEVAKEVSSLMNGTVKQIRTICVQAK